MKIKYKVTIIVIVTLICFNFLFTIYNIISHKNMKIKELNTRIIEKNKLLKETITQTLFDFDA